MNIDKKQEKKREENQDTQILLSKLAKDIAKDFNMNEKSARKFLKINISEGIEGIKDEIQKSQNEKLKSLKDEKLEKLLISIQGAQEAIKESSKIEMQEFKESVANSNIIEIFHHPVEHYLPKKLITKAKNPHNVHEHILGFSLGTTNSIFTTVETLYQIGKGIIQAPFHLYMIISGKGEYKGFKNI